ncbi:MAG: hypothetical protein HQL70_04645 [Magnetococcales bacterium]|nr:hypothetical protein [Magnetococcales bacterium]
MRSLQSHPVRFTLLLALVWASVLVLSHQVMASGSSGHAAEAHSHSDYTGGPPELEKAKGEACIRPTDWMRRNHMDFLKHRRGQTVREGLRIRSESLLKCSECHQSHEKFCDQCHNYVGVAPNCFECHIYPK